MKVSVPLPVYDPAGHKMAVYQLTVPSGATQYCICGSTTTLWFAGQVLGADRLGSLSYSYPYGENYTAFTPEQDEDNFATYYFDVESGLDYAKNRFYSSILGRFLTPDPYRNSIDQKNPGSLNRYAYAWDDPVNSNDPEGLCIINGETFPDPCFVATGVSSTGDFGGGYAPSGTGGSPGPDAGIGTAALQGALASIPYLIQEFQQAQSSFAAVLNIAAKAPANKNCASLFGSGIDPTTALQALYGNIGSLFPTATVLGGTSVSSSFSVLTYGSDAVEYKALVVGFFNGQPYAGIGARVDLNVSEWDSLISNGNTSLAAAILLHELGHVYNDIPGSGGSKITDDANNSAETQKNTALILKDCDLVF